MDPPAGNPIQEAALSFWEAGLCPMPCGGADGKHPLLKNRNWRQRPSRQTVCDWIRDSRFAGANIGLLTGLSELTVVDIDDPATVPELLDLFGPTPITVSTPGGGTHLWYRSSGERCANLRHRGFAADIKGIGGFVVAPPSIHPTNGRRYRFESGGPTTFGRLPAIGPRAAQWLASTTANRDRRRAVPGHRNDLLFREALRVAVGCDTLDELKDELPASNRCLCDPPLPAPEIERIARSAWRYQVEGRNFSGGKGFGCKVAVRQRIGDPDAFWLFAILMEAHGVRIGDGVSFAISAKAMAASGVAAPLGVARIRKARERLIAAGLLQVVHVGGRHPGDVSLYRFGDLT
jgi:hypothetical protein